MSKSSLAFLLSFSLLGSAMALAQEATEQPAPPFMLAPGDATWTMDVGPLDKSAPGKNPAGAGSPELKQRRVVQKGSIRHEINVWSDGATTETWVINKMRLIGLGPNRGIHLLDPGRDPVTEAEVESSDFLSVPWIGLAAYVGPEFYEGRNCYHYRKPAPPASIPTTSGDADRDHIADLNRLPGEAWIDKTTKLMVAYSDGNKLYTFTFGPPPAGNLVPPPAYASLLKQYQQDMDPRFIPVPPH